MNTPSPDVVSLMVRLGDALGRAVRPASQAQELQRVVAGVRSMFSAAACSCAVAERDQSSLRFVAADGAGAEAIVGVRVPAGAGIVGWALMSDQPVMVADVAADSRFNRRVAEATNYVPTTVIAAPMLDGRGQVLGVIEVLDPAADITSSGHFLDVTAVVATVAASIVSLTSMYDALGTVLVAALAGATVGEEGFDNALAEVLSADDSGPDLGGLARSFHTLARLSPDSAVLAERLLDEVSRYARAHP